MVSEDYIDNFSLKYEDYLDLFIMENIGNMFLAVANDMASEEIE